MVTFLVSTHYLESKMDKVTKKTLRHLPLIVSQLVMPWGVAPGSLLCEMSYLF